MGFYYGSKLVFRSYSRMGINNLFLQLEHTFKNINRHMFTWQGPVVVAPQSLKSPKQPLPLQKISNKEEKTERKVTASMPRSHKSSFLHRQDKNSPRVILISRQQTDSVEPFLCGGRRLHKLTRRKIN